MSGVVILLVGALLCFYGIRSLHLAVLGVGFGLGWLVADLFNPSIAVLFLSALVGAVMSWVAVTLVFKLSALVIGGLAGAVAGARIAEVVQPGDNNWAMSAIVVLAIGIAAAFAADKYRARALLWLTSIGGASMMLNGLSRTADSLEFFRTPESAWQQAISTAAWIALAVAGWMVQRHLFADKLGVKNTLLGNTAGDVDRK